LRWTIQLGGLAKMCGMLDDGHGEKTRKLEALKPFSCGWGKVSTMCQAMFTDCFSVGRRKSYLVR